jgi:hypothetical protein
VKKKKAKMNRTVSLPIMCKKVMNSLKNYRRALTRFTRGKAGKHHCTAVFPSLVSEEYNNNLPCGESKA